jgi:PIN domain nuclease of toxin-antitoxin system
LSARASNAIANADEVLLSVTSCWEIAIKASLGKLTLTSPLERFLTEQIAFNRFELLHIELPHAVRVGTLPWHHRDPFDRLLAAQALHEKLAMVSADPVFRKYGVRRIW